MTSPTTLERTAAPLATAVRWTRAQWLLLMVVCTVLALDGLDVSMVGVALPSIGHELNLGTDSLQWIVSAYVLGYGSLLLLGGRLADLLGRRRIFLIALSVFAAASLLGGLVDDPAILIATRFVKGLAAAFTAPTGFSIITTNFAEGRERNKALSIFTTFGASGFSLGLVVGGLMTSLSWRWTFLVSVPIAVLVVILGNRFIPRDTPDATDSGHDIWAPPPWRWACWGSSTRWCPHRNRGGDLPQQSPGSLSRRGAGSLCGHRGQSQAPAHPFGILCEDGGRASTQRALDCSAPT